MAASVNMASPSTAKHFKQRTASFYKKLLEEKKSLSQKLLIPLTTAMSPGAKVVHFSNDDDDNDHFVIHENKYASKRKRNDKGTPDFQPDQAIERPESKRSRPLTQKQEKDLQRRRIELLAFRKSLPVYSGTMIFSQSILVLKACY
jgi:hypothetical protein